MPKVFSLAALLIAASIHAQDWPQFGRSAQHDGRVSGSGNHLDRIEAAIVVDPFADAEKDAAGGDLIVHYPVPLVDGDDLYLLEKGGAFTTLSTRETQTWSVKNVRRVAGQYMTRWTFATDWKPVPSGSLGGPGWEPLFHAALAPDAVWAPGLGGTMNKIRRSDGVLIARINPFGSSIDPTIFTAGPPALDAAGNLYYNAIQLNENRPWTTDPKGSWLVRIAANGAASKVAFASLVPNAPAPDEFCTAVFSFMDLPWPPNPNAIAPAVRCGPQRPGINSTPAIGADGTIYTVSRAHGNDRYSFLVAVNAGLTAKWAASLRNRFLDGCNVGLPPNGTPGGCRGGSMSGVDPADNQPGSGRVFDDATSSPVVLPDGNVLYGAYTRYNYAQGHLMKFSAAGAYLGAYGFGWDITPGVYRHGTTYSIVLKENHYDLGSYCADPVICPERTSSAPSDPERYFITQLDPSLGREWQFRNTETLACKTLPNGTFSCTPQGDNGFEWCVNAMAIDGNGVVYANSEDGNLYAINQGGTLRQRIFLSSALGAAYTPLSISGDGRIFSQNNGTVFVVSGFLRRRAAGR